MHVWALKYNETVWVYYFKTTIIWTKFELIFLSPTTLEGLFVLMVP